MSYVKVIVILKFKNIIVKILFPDSRGTSINVSSQQYSSETHFPGILNGSPVTPCF
jgi:hypothetical protein